MPTDGDMHDERFVAHMLEFWERDMAGFVAAQSSGAGTNDEMQRASDFVRAAVAHSDSQMYLNLITRARKRRRG